MSVENGLGPTKTKIRVIALINALIFVVLLGITANWMVTLLAFTLMFQSIVGMAILILMIVAIVFLVYLQVTCYKKALMACERLDGKPYRVVLIPTWAMLVFAVLVYFGFFMIPLAN